MTDISKTNNSPADHTQAPESLPKTSVSQKAAEQSVTQVASQKQQFESRLKNPPSKIFDEHQGAKLDKQIKTALKVVGGRIQEPPNKGKHLSGKQANPNSMKATPKELEGRIQEPPNKGKHLSSKQANPNSIKTTPKELEGHIQELPDKRKHPFDKQTNQNLNLHEHNHQHIAQMQAESMKETPQATVQQPQDVKPVPQSLHKVVEEITNRILTSQDASNAEVRIQLKASVFGGSDIRIFREHGELKVLFVASSQEAQSQISQHTSKMESMLRERMPQEKVRVRVEGKDREGQSGQQTKQ